MELHGCLYGGERMGERGDEVRELVEESYASTAGKFGGKDEPRVGGVRWADGVCGVGCVQCSRTRS